MKTTNFEAETWFQRPETPSRVLEPLGTKINFAACHRSDAMVAKKVEYRSDLKYGVTVVSHQMASADSPGSPLGFQTPPPLPRWPLEAMMASRHQARVWKPSGVTRRVPDTSSTQTASGVAQGLQGLRAPREESGGHQGSCRASRHLSALQPGVWKLTLVAQGFHVPPGTQTSSRKPPDLQTPPSPPYCTHMTSGGLSED